MKTFMTMLIALFFSSSLAMAEERVTSVGAAAGGVVGAVVGAGLCGGGKGGSFACGLGGLIVGSLIGNELEEKARAPRDPVSHNCRSGFRPIEIVSTTMPDPRACLLNEQFEASFVDWSCPETHPRHALGVDGNKPLCLNPSMLVEANTIRQQTGYTKRDPNAWWPCKDPKTGQAWQEHLDGTWTQECYKDYTNQPQPGTFQNADYARGRARAAEQQERAARYAAEQAGYRDGMGQQPQQTSGGLFKGRVASFR